ncbi:MAG: ThuA domain-containing protein [Planctomycetes bacterium]|nr:ThuA domain-containing protein [Planctomycetota bacterium]
MRNPLRIGASIALACAAEAAQAVPGASGPPDPAALPAVNPSGLLAPRAALVTRAARDTGPLPLSPVEGSPSADRRPRLLVLTRSWGFEHDVVRRASPQEPSLVERALVAWGEEVGYEAVLARDTAEFEPERLARHAGVLFYTTGELPLSAPQRAAFLAAIEGGLGFVGIHPATDTGYAWPEYGALIGAYFDGHPWHERVRVRVPDRTHPATRDLDPVFEIVDEIYQFRAPYDRARLHVLLELDTDAVDLARPGVNRTDRDFALAWTRSQGRGRVFYTALGHRPEVWSDARFAAHVRGGIAWALGIDAPRPALRPEDEALRAFVREHPGDPARGHAVFRRTSGPMCIRCHAVHGEGAVVGPDLSRLGRERTREEILEQILAPSARIAAGYRATVLELADGTLVTGRVQEESAERIALVDAAAERRELDPRQVVDRRESPASLMPDGLARTLTPTEFADLVAWLQTLRGS